MILRNEFNVYCNAILRKYQRLLRYIVNEKDKIESKLEKTEISFKVFSNIIMV